MEASRLPLEPIQQIIDCCSDDKDILKSLALTASALVFYAQSYLFQRIDLDLPGDCCINEDSKAYENFDEILRHSPVVGSYVHKLVIGHIFLPKVFSTPRTVVGPRDPLPASRHRKPTTRVNPGLRG